MNKRGFVVFCLFSCFLMTVIPFIPTVQAIEVENEIESRINSNVEQIQNKIINKLRFGEEEIPIIVRIIRVVVAILLLPIHFIISIPGFIIMLIGIILVPIYGFLYYFTDILDDTYSNLFAFMFSFGTAVVGWWLAWPFWNCLAVIFTLGEVPNWAFFKYLLEEDPQLIKDIIIRIIQIIIFIPLLIVETIITIFQKIIELLNSIENPVYS